MLGLYPELTPIQSQNRCLGVPKKPFSYQYITFNPQLAHNFIIQRLHIDNISLFCV